MNQDLKKFEELLKTDAAFQEKLQKAVENYTGDPTDEKAIFETIIDPVAKEEGLSASFEEYKAYTDQLKAAADEANLSFEELAQVSGGKAGGLGLTGCFAIGYGLGVSGGEGGGELCVLTGLGWGTFLCGGEGTRGDNKVVE